MHDERRHHHPWKEIADIDAVHRAAYTHCVLRRSRLALQNVEPLHLLRSAAGKKSRSIDHPKFRTLLTPPLAHEGEYCISLFDLALRATLAPSPGIAAVENEPGHSLGVKNRIGDGDGAALGNPEQRESLEAGRVHYRFEIAHEGFEGDVGDVPVREAVAARVVADEPVRGGDFVEQVAPDRTFPIVF